MSSLNGVLQTQGGWPTLVAGGEDPVEQVIWSPASAWLAYLLALGGG